MLPNVVLNPFLVHCHFLTENTTDLLRFYLQDDNQTQHEIKEHMGKDVLHFHATFPYVHVQNRK